MKSVNRQTKVGVVLYILRYQVETSLQIRVIQTLENPTWSRVNVRIKNEILMHVREHIDEQC